MQRLILSVALAGCAKARPLELPAVSLTDLNFGELDSDPTGGQLQLDLKLANPNSDELHVSGVEAQLVADGTPIARVSRGAFVIAADETTDVFVRGRAELAKLPLAVIAAMRDRTASWVVDGAVRLDGRAVPIHIRKFSNSNSHTNDCKNPPLFPDLPLPKGCPPP